MSIELKKGFLNTHDLIYILSYRTAYNKILNKVVCFNLRNIDYALDRFFNQHIDKRKKPKAKFTKDNQFFKITSSGLFMKVLIL